MGFIPKTPAKPSKATGLHLQYNPISSGKSQLKDWKTIVERVGEQKAELLYTFVTRNFSSFPSSPWLVRNLDTLMAQAEQDPELSGYPVTDEAKEMVNRSLVYGISEEYVQQALDRYRLFLRELQAYSDDVFVGMMIWSRLPAAWDFAIEWYRDIKPNGTPRHRRLVLDSHEFRSYVRAWGRNMGVSDDRINACISDCIDKLK